MITNYCKFSSSPMFKGLIPKSQYKGTILKLTSDEKSKIAKYQQEIGKLELEHMKLADFYAKNEYNDAAQDYYANQMQHLEYAISILKDMILEIKINRLNKQKAKANKKLDIKI